MKIFANAGMRSNQYDYSIYISKRTLTNLGGNKCNKQCWLYHLNRLSRAKIRRLREYVWEIERVARVVLHFSFRFVLLHKMYLF